MKQARSDYNRIKDLDNLIPEDEPVFLIRGQDAVGADTVRDWANRAAAAGADPEIVDAALRHAHLMDEWPKKKVPDAPEGTV